jgi:hypothetical protein
VSAEEDAARDLLSKCGDGILQAIAIASGVTRTRRTIGSQLPEREVTSKNGEARPCEGLSKRY